MAFWPYEFAMGFPWRTHGLYGDGKFIWPKSHGKLMDVSWDISVRVIPVTHDLVD